jgi:hypothetical protein
MSLGLSFNPFPKSCTLLQQKYLTIFCCYEKISVHKVSRTYQVCDPLLPISVGIKTWIWNGKPWNTTPCCISDMYKLSYSASFAQNTRHLRLLPFSSQCRMCLASIWLVESVGIPCIIWVPSTLPPSCMRSLIKLSQKSLWDNFELQEWRIM